LILKNLRESPVVCLIVIIILGLVVRYSLAPYTTGSDIPQFAGFTDTFLSKTLCFFKHTKSENAISENWPYPWPYPYGPFLVVLLSIPRMLAPSPVVTFWRSGVYYVYAPIDWIVASKSVFIFFDTLSMVLIFSIVKYYSIRKALIAAFLYFLNPVTIYVSSIYGMFDSVALSIQLTSIIAYLRFKEDNRVVFNAFIPAMLAGVSVSIKPNVLFPAIVILIYTSKPFIKTYRNLAAGILGFLTGLLTPYLPFELFCPGSLYIHLEVLFSTSSPGYTLPLCYSFNGFSNIATYLNKTSGGDFAWITEYWWIPALILHGFLAQKIAVEKINDKFLLENILVSYLIFLTTYWRVNYQYFTPMVAYIFIYLFSMENRLEEKSLVVTHHLLTIVWFFMFPISWWAHAHIEHPDYSLIKFLDSISLMVFPDEAYLLYSIILTFFGYITITALLHPRRPCSNQEL